jgi:hypothetical protein
VGLGIGGEKKRRSVSGTLLNGTAVPDLSDTPKFF